MNISRNMENLETISGKLNEVRKQIDKAKKAGAQVHLQTRVNKIIKQDGKINGLMAEDRELIVFGYRITDSGFGED